MITNQAANISNNHLSSVGTDDVNAAEEITDYLIKNGHTKIGVIGGNIIDSEISERRFKGFLNAVKKNNISFDFDKQYQTAKYSFEGGEEAIEKLIKKSEGITAAFSMSDVQAIGAIRRLNDMGMSVPDDISVTGFDGLPLTQYIYPRLTTIRQSEMQLAKCGLAALLEAITKEDEEAAHLLIPYEFLEGESVSKIN